MGEAAEDILDGTVCQACGTFFDDIISGHEAPGHVRLCRACIPATERSRQVNQARSKLAFSCPGCGRSFAHKGDLRQHCSMKRH